MRGTFLVLVVAACGGGTAATPPPRAGGCVGGAMSHKEGGDDGVCSQESLEEVQRFFRGHSRTVTTCFSQAMRDGKLPKNAEGRVTAEMVIDLQGRPTGVRIAGSAFKAVEMDACIVNVISGWTVPKPDVAFHFSFAYEFHAE